MGILGQVFGKSTRVQFIQNSTSTVIQFDASMKETHKRSSPATEFPVENGQTISDHVILKPFALELTGIITDSPLAGTQALISEVTSTLASKLLPPVGVVAAAGAYSLFKALSNSQSPSVAAYGQLLTLQANAQPFDVLTSLYRYASMWIIDLSAPRTAETGKSLEFTVQLAQLILVSPQSVNVQIFANPALSANQGDLGQQGLNIPNGFQAGLKQANSLVGGNALNGGG